MNRPVECPFEADVLEAVVESRWPGRVDAELRNHVRECAVCSDVAAVAGAIGQAGERERIAAVVPDAGRVWWTAQLRARREAVKQAARPITAFQMIAFSCALGLLCACFGATSTWFQALLRRTVAAVPAPDFAGLAATLGAMLVEHSVFVLGLAAIVLAVPAAVLVVLSRD
jgi:hypothetical protein